MGHRGWIGVLSLLSWTWSDGPLSAQVAPDERARFESARRLIGEERYPEARQALQELVTDVPELTPPYRSFVEVSSLIEDLPAAASYFDGRLAADPSDGYAYYGRGLVANEMGDYDLAIASLNRALQLRPTLVEAVDDRGGLTAAFQKKGALDEAPGEFRRRIQEDPDDAVAHYGLARVRFMRYEWDDALESARRAIALEATMLRAQSLLVYVLSRTSARKRDLLGEIERLRDLAISAADLDMESYAELQFGVAYQNLGDYGLSLQHVNEGLHLARLYGQRARELILLNNAATLYATAGNMEQAARFFAEVAEHAGSAGESGLEVISLVNLGHTRRENDGEEAFRDYERALMLSRENHFRHGECLALHSLGAYQAERENYLRADEVLAEALQCTREIGDRRQEGHILEQIADGEEKRGALDRAAAIYQQAVDIGEELDNIEIRWDAEGGLASTFERMGDRERAIAHNMRAIAIYESVRASLDIDSVGSGFLDDKDEVYPSVVRLLAEAGRLDEAFFYAERYKAKNLLANVARNAGMFAEQLPESLRERLGEIESELRSTREALAEAEASSGAAREEILFLEQRLGELELKRAALSRELQATHAELYRLIRAEPLDVAAIRSRVLAEGQVLLEYVVSEKDTSAFVITRDEVRYRLLSVGREELVRLMAAWSPVFAEKASSGRSAAYFNPVVADFSAPGAQALYDALVGPVETLIPARSELVIVPDDVLFYLPFEALVADFSGDNPYDFERATFLLERHAISYASAASLLEPVSEVREPAPGMLLALGNPSFQSTVDETDPSGTLAPTAMASYASAIVRDDGLLALPNSEDEVHSIARIVGRGTSRVAVGDEASEALFKEQAESYRILHLATHFLANDRQPLYSKLALAVLPGSDEDGYLQVYEVLERKLRAELVVLSACNTGLGRLQRGEGLLGATRAFLYAGVPSMVVSLWSVEDRATAEIMERFYVYLKEGRDKRDALRQAKLDYLETARGEKKDPFYWAPFILIGDSSPMSFAESPAGLWWLLPLVILALAAVVASSRTLKAARRAGG